MAHLNKMSGLVQKLKGNPGSNPNARKNCSKKDQSSEKKRCLQSNCRKTIKQKN